MFAGRERIRIPYQRDDIAEDYIDRRYGRDPFGRALHERQARLLRKVVSRQQVRKLLEIAPGPARLTVYASATECAYGVEQSAAMLRVAKARLAEFGADGWRLAANRWLHHKWGVQEQWIADYWFTEETFRAEMRDAGFRVATMYPVHPALPLQYYTWAYLWRLSPLAAQVVSRALEVVTLREPLEWMALCVCE